MQAYFIAAGCEFIVQPKRIYIVVVLTLPMPVRLEMEKKALFSEQHF